MGIFIKCWAVVEVREVEVEKQQGEWQTDPDQGGCEMIPGSEQIGETGRKIAQRMTCGEAQTGDQGEKEQGGDAHADEEQAFIHRVFRESARDKFCRSRRSDGASRLEWRQGGDEAAGWIEVTLCIDPSGLLDSFEEVRLIPELEMCAHRCHD